MTADQFEGKMNGLLMFTGDWRTNELFKAEMQEMIHDVGLQHAMGGGHGARRGASRLTDSTNSMGRGRGRKADSLRAGAAGGCKRG